jgi:hypothetical protein
VTCVFAGYVIKDLSGISAAVFSSAYFLTHLNSSDIL